MQPPSFRYRKPGYVALDITNMERSLKFYRDLVGLTLEERHSDEAAFLRCSEDHHNLVLYKGSEPGIRRMGFQMESEHDLDAAQEYIQGLGWPVREVSSDELAVLRQGRTIRFRMPASSLTFELYADMKEAGSAFEPTVARIQRLGHVVLRCADREAVLKTLTGNLNFRVSDHFGDAVAFLRCFPNRFHHSFGVAKGTDDGLHHVNFMVTDVDDVGRAYNRMRNAGVEIVYGPGRHDISNSIFLYYLDPDGLTVEYSFGMEEFPELGAREARQLPMKPEILDCWGGMPAPNFGRNGVVATADLS